jgi:rhamnosyltransferase subunit B
VTGPDQPTTAGERAEGKRIVLTTFGSLGDLHPYIAIALGLRARGHHVTLATHESYRPKAEALGLDFRPVRPDLPDWRADPDLARRLMDPHRGTFRIIRELVLPGLRQSYDDTTAAVDGADLLVAHPLTYATRLVAERRGIPWASSMHSPAGFWSAHEPPLLPGAAGPSRLLRPLGPAFWGPLGRWLKRATRPWAGPIDRLRGEIGLPPAADNPLVDGHSPALHLALFSGLLAPKQADWPAQTVVTGFPFHDRGGGAGLPPALSGFLDAGPPPVAFTLGTSSVLVTGSFFEHGLAAAGRLGLRSVLVVGDDPRHRPATLPEGAFAVEYAPFSELFPRCAAVVHHGGVGTTGLAMRAGRPMLVMPEAHDQPENAERVRRLGIARTTSRRRWTPARIASELGRLLGDPAYSRRAAEVGVQIRREDGVGAACEALETLIRTIRHPRAVDG